MDKKQNDRYVLNVGIKNKVYYFLAKYMPLTFVYKTLVKKYQLKNKWLHYLYGVKEVL